MDDFLCGLCGLCKGKKQIRFFFYAVNVINLGCYLSLFKIQQAVAPFTAMVVRSAENLCSFYSF